MTDDGTDGEHEPERRRAETSGPPDESLAPGDGQPDDASGEAFVRKEVPEIDADVVWEQLGTDGSAASDPDEREVRVIEKRTFCERCEHFSTPEAVRCTHDGTEILELVDVDHFRVADCPKVREQERLEGL